VNRLRRALALTAVLGAGLTLAGPTWATTRPAVPNQTTSSVLRIGMPDSALTVDPALVADEQNVELAGLLYSGLVRLNAGYQVVKDTAARYTVSKDHTTYTFYLRKDAQFSNGDPVVASDFKFAILRSLNPALKSPSAPTYLMDIKGAYDYLTGKSKTVSGIRVINSHTIAITARWPVPYFLMELAYPTSFALDEKRIGAKNAASTSWYSNPVGSGPYRLKSWSGGSRMVLVANTHYFGSKPAVPQVTITLASLPATGVYPYVTHNFDVMALPAYDPTLLLDPGIRETPTLAIDGIYMNMRRAPLDNRQVRRALVQALNRTQLVKDAMKGSATPFQGYVPSGQAGFDPHLKLLPYRVKVAQSQLANAGFKGGKGFPAVTLYYPDDPSVAVLAQTIAAAWHKNLKIKVDTAALTLNTLFAKVQADSLALYLFGWSADYPDPHDWLSLQWESGALNNNVHYQNPAFDRLVQAADVTQKAQARMAKYNQAQQVLVDDAAWMPLYIPHRLVYVRPSVNNISVTGFGVMPRSGSWANVGFRQVRRRSMQEQP
jgi:ABC-type oligopeptide transport system substrate-binding subunit